MARKRNCGSGMKNNRFMFVYCSGTAGRGHGIVHPYESLRKAEGREHGGVIPLYEEKELRISLLSASYNARISWRQKWS